MTGVNQHSRRDGCLPLYIREGLQEEVTSLKNAWLDCLLHQKSNMSPGLQMRGLGVFGASAIPPTKIKEGSAQTVSE